MKSDRQLWQEVLRGESDAFAEIFSRYAQGVYNFCFRCTADWSSSEDLVAEVFFVAWRRRNDIVFTQETGSIAPWLFGVAANVARNARRSRRRASSAAARLSLIAGDRVLDDPAGRVADERLMRDILRAIDELPSGEREAIVMCVFGDLAIEDAAVALDVPAPTLRSRLFRARRRLRAMLATENEAGKANAGGVAP